jgi:FAD dependent oxidoreductase TIGR03364
VFRFLSEASIMTDSPRLCVVGGGIVGLAHAWRAVERGWRVTLFERSPQACGASIRNFGMVWPIGQPAGEPLATALASRRLWRELAARAGLRAEPVGSIHVACCDDEWAVLEEFAARGPARGYDVRLLSRREVLDRTPAVREAILGGLWSGMELAVDPPQAISRLTRWLADERGVDMVHGVAVTAVEPGLVRLADGRIHRCERVVVASGSDLETLFPQALAGATVRCKLQMLATVPQPGGFRVGPHLAGGLTLRHYRSFAICPSRDRLAERIAFETPELNQFGIHVMASQDAAGRLILGDSHEYDAAISPIDSAEIEGLILRELRRWLAPADWTIGSRWHGIYAKVPDGSQLALEPAPGVWIRTGLGGAGMTMALGLAEQDWKPDESTA